MMKMMTVAQVEIFVNENSEGVSLSHFWSVAGTPPRAMSQSEVQRIIERCEVCS
jgi:hypothetical protein